VCCHDYIMLFEITFTSIGSYESSEMGIASVYVASWTVLMNLQFHQYLAIVKSENPFSLSSPATEPLP
jgi:hypothetical protein